MYVHFLEGFSSLNFTNIFYTAVLGHSTKYSSRRLYSIYHGRPWVKTKIFNLEFFLLSVSMRNYVQNKIIYILYVALWDTNKACVKNDVSGGYMDDVFKCVARKQSEIWTSLSHSFIKEVLPQLPGE